MMRRVRAGAIAVAVVLAFGISIAFPDLWLTRDQQALRLLRRGEHERAAEMFVHPQGRAIAAYRAGDFKKSAALFSGGGTPEAAYNRGNALVFLGRYDDAIASYETALEARPGWDEARDNRDLAMARRITREGGEGTGGKLGADEIVFEEGGTDAPGEAVEVTDDEPVEGADLNALWLRNVRTRPADFLRLKFAYQASRRGDAGDAR